VTLTSARATQMTGSPVAWNALTWVLMYPNCTRTGHPGPDTRRHRRPVPALRAGGGSYPWHYVLGHLGAELIAAARDQPPPRPSETAQRIRQIATGRTLDHRLGVNQFFTDLAGHARTHPDARLGRWWSEARCAAPGAFCPGLVTPIRPDGHVIYTEDERCVAFFLEHDTGTESHAVLLAKLTRYDAHVTRGGVAWRVLFWLPNTARERHLHDQLTTLEVAVPIATATHTADESGVVRPCTATTPSPGRSA
jgi:hypothetical protein